MSTFLSLIACSLLVDANNITIPTQLGPITGMQQDITAVFRGVPYSHFAPIRDYRFKNSSLKKSLYETNPYDATYYRSACMQFPGPIFAEIISDQSEDCLYLNIWTPITAINSTELLPVLFWIHGGGFIQGAGSQILYEGDAFMNEENVVYVSINYRLGALGFLSLQSLFNETQGQSTGSLNGILDQVTALQWVQQYISDFGGDPNRVTIFGESAGGYSVCMLLATELAQNLFNKAIIQSGPCLGIPISYADGLQATQSVLERLNVTDDLEILRDLDVSQFRFFVLQPSADGHILFNPINDTTLPLNADKLIIGFNSLDSLRTFPYFLPTAIQKLPSNENALKYYLKTYIDNDTYIELIVNELYPIEEFTEYSYHDDIVSDYGMIWNTINADVCFICPSIHYAQLLQQNNQIADSIYLYNFMGAADPYYAPHGAEIPFIFNKSDTATTYFDASWNHLLSNLMSDIWKNYVIAGNPNSSMLDEEWIPFGNNKNSMTFIDENGFIQSNVILNYRNGACDFWMNTANVDERNTLCLQSISIPSERDDIKGLEIWQFAVIVIGALLVVAILGLFIFCMFCGQDRGSYNNMDNTELAQNNDYGAASNQN